ncbi:NAD(P)H-hydrate dehydratase [Candidatus Parvarchaeota archaeon]|nr:NAD(P)H-hydrate dehydratase [Candidatus Parvarchaeota archaeon]
MNFRTVDNKILGRIYRKRNPWSYKGNFGKLLVIGGSAEYTGSPALVALAASKAGCDFVKIAAPRRSADVCASFSPEIITHQLDGPCLTKESIDDMGELIRWSKTISLGNGIGVGEKQSEFVNRLISSMDKKTVVDADAIKLLREDNINSRLLLTPNTNEFNVLFKSKLSNDVQERARIVKEKARQYNTTILLKGHVDVISDGEEIFLNKINSVYMTKAGTGDVLTGICSGIMSQGNTPLESAIAGAFINGYTGRTLAKIKKEAVSPLDIINNIYSTISKWRYH